MLPRPDRGSNNRRERAAAELPESTSVVAIAISTATILVATLAATVATTTVPLGHATESALPTVVTAKALQYPTTTRLITHQMDEAIKSNLNNIVAEVVRTQEKHRLQNNGRCFIKELWREHRILADVVRDYGMTF